MAVPAEQVVIEVLAKVDQANAKIDAHRRTFEEAMAADVRAATTMEAGVERAANDAGQALVRMGGAARKAANDVEASSARAANASRNIGRQISDIGAQLAGGQSPLAVFAMQAPQIADALADTGGRAAKVAAFFSGPWGAALLAAGSIAGVLAEKLLFSGDAAEKARKNADGLRIAQDGLGDTTLKAADAVTVLNNAYANDRTASIASSARAAAAERLNQANATFQAARAEAQLRATQGRSRLADLSDGTENNRVVGRTVSRSRGGGTVALRSGQQLSTQQGRGGSELEQARATARQQIADAERDLTQLDQAFNRYSQLAVRRIIGTDQAIRDSRLALATALDEVTKAQERRNIVEREARILLDNRIIDETEYTKRVRAANQAVENAQTAARGAARERRAMANEAERAAKAEQKLIDAIKSPGTVAAELDNTNFFEPKSPVQQATDRFYASEGRDVMAELRATLDARDAQRQAAHEERKRAIEEAYDLEDERVRSLANIFEDAFIGGTDRVWENFEREGLRVLAVLVAKAAIAQATGKGGFFSTLASGATALFGGARANGGPVMANREYLVGERGPEIVRMNAPGVVIPNAHVTQRGATQQSTNITVSVDARNAADPAMTAQLVRQGILEAAPSIVAAAQGSTMRTITRPRLPGSNG